MKSFLIGLLKGYKKFLSPNLERTFGKACRFTPTCSDYTIEAVEKFGAREGLALGVRRFSHCHPFGGSGYDPVPDPKY